MEEIKSIMGIHVELSASYCLWFLEYKLTRVNSILHGRPWWILYMLPIQYQYYRQVSNLRGTLVGN